MPQDHQEPHGARSAPSQHLMPKGPDEDERQLRGVGLRAKMTVMDAGAGTGLIARKMSRIVGPRGRVIAVDCSAERIVQARRQARIDHCENVMFVRTDLTRGPAIEGAFDLVWCRFVFEYLEDPDTVLGHLVQCAKIGGKVAVGALDGNGLRHFPMSEACEDGLNRLLSALGKRFDPYAGRKLFHRFSAHPLGDIRVHVWPYDVMGASVSSEELSHWRARLRAMRPVGKQAFGGTSAYEMWAEEYLSHLSAPHVFSYSSLIFVEGRRLS